MRWFHAAVVATALTGAGCGDDDRYETSNQPDRTPEVTPTSPDVETKSAVALKGEGWIGETVNVFGPSERITAIAFFKPG